MLTVRPIGGLCNRMRVIASAHALAKRVKTDLTVVWLVDNDLAADYYHLFVDNGLYEVKCFYPGKSLMAKAFSLKYSVSPNPILRLCSMTLRKLTFDIDLDGSRLSRGEPGDHGLVDLIADKNAAYFSTCSRFYINNDFSYSIFKPKPDLSLAIEKVASTFSKDTVGVHIRRADNVKAIQKSPLDGFIGAIDAEIQRNQNANFFLATDCLETEGRLIERFPDRITTREKDLSRASLQGMFDAVIDLYSLSRTSKIIGSYWSSFSLTAAELGEIPCVIIDVAKQ